MTPAESSALGTPADAAPRDRKAEHIRLALERSMQLEAGFFDDWRFEHCALPEIDLADVDTSVAFLGRRLAAPLLISCMTGGTDEAEAINRNLARAAQATGIALGVGSQRKAIEDPRTRDSFRVRDLAPDVPLLANLGAVQLNYGFGVEECRAAVEMIDADALVFHLNPLQEAIQPEGQVNFAGLKDKMAEVAAALDVPVGVKEVGCGISRPVAEALVDAGLRLIDTAGLGGTSWARIEAQRADTPDLGERFADWGVPTPQSIRELADLEGITLIGSGGLRSGIDVAKAIAMGADVAGMAYPFLGPAAESAAAVEATIRQTIRELVVSMFCVGARTLEALREAPLVRVR